MAFSFLKKKKKIIFCKVCCCNLKNAFTNFDFLILLL